MDLFPVFPAYASPHLQDNSRAHNEGILTKDEENIFTFVTESSHVPAGAEA